MRRMSALMLPLAAAVLLGLVALVPAGEGDPPRPAQPVEVTQTAYACPAGSGRLLAATQVAAGSSAQALTLPEQEPVEALQDPTLYRTVRGAAPDVLVRQEGAGSGAVGFVSGVRDGDLTLAPCPGVVDEAWFTALGSTTRHSSTLLLTNLADAPAVADIALFGPDGPVETVDGDGVVVEPLSTRRVRLSDLAAGADDVAMQVQRRRGALTAVVLDDSAAGTDLLTSAAAPRSTSIVGPLTASGADRVLRIVNPADVTARVAVQVRSADGPFTPEGLEEVEVGPQSSRAIDLPAVVGDAPATLVLTSSTPVTGAVQTTGNEDTTSVGSSAPWSGAAVVPLRLGGPRLQALTLGSGDADGRVSIAALDEAGQSLAETRVEVPAETTLDVELADLAIDEAASLVLRSDGGVSGAASFADGDGRAVLPLVAAPVTAAGPAVRWGVPRG